MTKQRTIAKPVTIKGLGLQTGCQVNITLKSAPINSGISFIRTDLPGKPLLNIQSMIMPGASGQDRRTTLSQGAGQVQTTEHLLAALSGLSIDNIVIEIDNVELPGLDGSAEGFLGLIKSARIVEQDAEKNIFIVKDAVWCAGGNGLIAVFPSDEFRISYTLSYPGTPLGSQFFSLVINENNFAKDIAPARTFCLEAEAQELLKRGLGKGANYDNTLVIGKDGPINNAFRFPDEPVRHKVLDLVGDLYLLGRHLQGHVVAIKSGHALNMELVRKLKGKI